jgi:hypothetical protein
MTVEVKAAGAVHVFEFVNNRYIAPPAFTHTVFAEAWRESVNIRYFLGGTLVEIPLTDIVLEVDGVVVSNIRDYTLNVANWQMSTHTLFISKTKTPWTNITVTAKAAGQTIVLSYVNNM